MVATISYYHHDPLLVPYYCRLNNNNNNNTFTSYVFWIFELNNGGRRRPNSCPIRAPIVAAGSTPPRGRRAPTPTPSPCGRPRNVAHVRLVRLSLLCTTGSATLFSAELSVCGLPSATSSYSATTHPLFRPRSVPGSFFYRWVREPTPTPKCQRKYLISSCLVNRVLYFIV